MGLITIGLLGNDCELDLYTRANPALQLVHSGKEDRQVHGAKCLALNFTLFTKDPSSSLHTVSFKSFPSPSS